MTKSVELTFATTNDRKYKTEYKDESYFNKLLKEKIRQQSLNDLNKTIADVNKERL